MQIKRLAATFGRLENATLDLEPGLNVIDAPNEGGKSTWTAFLRVMFYGLSTKDRSPNADKRRYQPWSGSAMAGVMDAATARGEVTVTRRTARANAPMGQFTAVYAGTSDSVEWLTAADCGETLLGVPQDVYERSAFIRQSGLTVDQSSALEKRIASLITTGEEGTSFSDASDRLKKQLNTRRHNKTGRLPQLEDELAELRGAQEELTGLTASLEADLERERALQAEIAQLRELLEAHNAADQADTAAAAESARLDLVSAQDKLRTLEYAARGLPPQQELIKMRGALDYLAAQRGSAEQARERMDMANGRLRRTELAMNSHPLSGRTPEEAARVPPDLGPKPKPNAAAAVLSLIAGVVLALTVALYTQNLIAAIGSGCGLFGALVLLTAVFPFLRAKKKRAEREEELIRHRADQVAAYTILYRNTEDARAAARDASAAHEAAASALEASRGQILAQIRSYRPLVKDMGDALQAVTAGLAAHDELDQARRAEEAARLRWEARRDSAPEPPAVPVARPAEDRDRLWAQLQEDEEHLAILQRRIHTTQGRIQAMGDPALFQSRIEGLETQRRSLQREYDAIALALEVLAASNGALQNRFSPALGQRAAEIFTQLTRGKYDKVLLSKELAPSAQEAGAMVPHEAALLSQGAADQLYLAVRLAISDMVLPAENAVPIVLDDALVNFDDGRMAAALDYLVELSKTRQILLMTCQSREAAYLAKAHPGKFHHIQL